MFTSYSLNHALHIYHARDCKGRTPSLPVVDQLPEVHEISQIAQQRPKVMRVASSSNLLGELFVPQTTHVRELCRRRFYTEFSLGFMYEASSAYLEDLLDEELRIAPQSTPGMTDF